MDKVVTVVMDIAVAEAEVVTTIVGDEVVTTTVVADNSTTAEEEEDGGASPAIVVEVNKATSNKNSTPEMRPPKTNGLYNE